MGVPKGHSGMTLSYSVQTAADIATIARWYEEVTGIKLSKTAVIRWAVSEIAKRIKEEETKS